MPPPPVSRPYRQAQPTRSRASRRPPAYRETPVICLAPFVEGAEAQKFSLQAVLNAFDRHTLVEGSRARKAGAECACTIEFLLDPNPYTTPWVYAVLHEDVSERELEPLAEPPASSVQELFGRLSCQSLKFFRAQGELIAAFRVVMGRMESNLWPAAVGAVGASLLDCITDPHIDVFAVGEYLLSGANP